MANLRLIPLSLSLLILAPSTIAAPAPDPIPVGPGDLDDVDQFIADLEAEWLAYDAVCAPEAVFALTYLITSKGVRDFIAANHFADNPYVADWDHAFALYYMEAIQERASGDPSPVWDEAYDWMDTGMSTGYEDVLLGMNAHIRYDLAMATYESGLVAEGRKADYDRINDVFSSVMQEVATEVGLRYAPAVLPGADETLAGPVMQAMIEDWRAYAWHAAERMENAPWWAKDWTRWNIENEVILNAQLFQVWKLPTTGFRQAYCQEYHDDPTSHDWLLGN